MKTEVTEDIVRLAYRLMLGRPAESDEAVKEHLRFATLEQLRRHMMDSLEFKSKQLQARFSSASKWVAVDVLDGFVQWVDLHYRYVSHGCLSNDWEPSETSYFVSKLRAGDIVLDIGANIGWFSLVAARHIGKSGAIYAFEPRPETVKMLKRTMADNRLRDRVQVLEFALSDTWSTLDLVWRRGTDNPGESFVAGPNQAMEHFESAKVTAGVLDDILPDVAPDIIKIDVEGAEPKVMRGAQNALKRKHPPILSELFPHQLQAVSGASARQYIDQMQSYGYACYLLENGVPTKRLADFPSGGSRELESVVFEWNGQRR